MIKRIFGFQVRPTALFLVISWIISFSKNIYLPFGYFLQVLLAWVVMIFHCYSKC